MKNRHIIPVFTFLILLMAQNQLRSQDMSYSQYFSTPIYYNPGFTGINSGLRARFLFRDQWPSLPSPFKSYYFSADLGDRNLPGSGGIGLLINQDTPGPGSVNLW
jgi:type IX secretion system PorP/SprF family membrane protein